MEMKGEGALQCRLKLDTSESLKPIVVTLTMSPLVRHRTDVLRGQRRIYIGDSSKRGGCMGRVDNNMPIVAA